MRLVAFCEGVADFRIASDLVDRVLREAGPSWIGDVLDMGPEGLRVWREDGEGRPFFDVHRLGDYEKAWSVRVPHGHFDGRRGAAGALMGRSVFAIVRRLVKTGETIDAVVLTWDMDDQAADRRRGLEQARGEATQWAPFAIVVGLPNAMREAWVLTAFEPASPEETERLSELRRELGFRPDHEAHRLGAADEQAKGSAKRVLRLLVSQDRDRERRCWIETPLATLRARSGDTGLREYLDEIEATLVRLATR